MAKPQADLDDAIKQVKEFQNGIDTANVEITNARRLVKTNQRASDYFQSNSFRIQKLEEKSRQNQNESNGDRSTVEETKRVEQSFGKTRRIGEESG